jgi:hypothetical protein
MLAGWWAQKLVCHYRAIPDVQGLKGEGGHSPHWIGHTGPIGSNPTIPPSFSDWSVASTPTSLVLPPPMIQFDGSSSPCSGARGHVPPLMPEASPMVAVPIVPTHSATTTPCCRRCHPKNVKLEWWRYVQRVLAQRRESPSPTLHQWYIDLGLGLQFRIFQISLA